MPKITTQNIQSWLNGEKLHSLWHKHSKLLVLWLVLLMVYIYMGYRAASLQHSVSDMQKELLDAKYEYLTISAQLVSTTKQSEIAATLEQKGSTLRDNTTPPIKITKR